MKNRFELIGAASVLVVSMLACNLSAASNASQPDYVATITAQAAQLGGQPAQAVTPTASAVRATTGTTNCRSGPGTAYSIVTTFKAGQQVTVVGQDTADDYWIVDVPDGQGTCWLWGQYATITGDPSGLPQMTAASNPAPAASGTPRATKTPKSAAGPVPGPLAGIAVSTSYCKLVKTSLGTYNYEVRFIIAWIAPNDNSVIGYHVYRDGKLISTFEVGPTYYQDDIAINGVSVASLPTVQHTYTVSAYNQFGDSPRAGGSTQCP